MPFEFTPERRAHLDDLLTHYPTKRAATLPALHLAQAQNGYISQDVMEHVAELLDLSPAQVQDVVTFYPMFFQEPVGKHIIRVCKTLPCMLCDCKKVLDHLRESLEVEVEGTTADGNFTLLEVECLAACDQAPVMMVDEDLYGNLTPEKIDEILGGITGKAAPAKAERRHGRG
ncbi:NADH-quinone oxidoreductase subunit NuoE [Candidatus Poribacteria bacterium]|nr:NADH-quinone oxidoreductase subunit NuoE [Candidatus Poribacteria bacterium]